MIRPVTFLCASAFVFSGFHLYQTKQVSQDVDHQIVRTMKQVNEQRNSAVLLRAEYALLNDPTRLQDLAQQHLPTLRPTAPTQFVAMDDLARRLPPIGPGPDAVPAATPDAPSLGEMPGGGPAISDIPMASVTPPPAAAAAPAPAPVAVAAAAVPAPRPVETHAPAPRPAVVAAAAPMESVVRSVSLVRPLPRRAEPAAPLALHPAQHGRQLPYVSPTISPVRPAAVQPAAMRREPPAYAPPAYAQAPYAPPRYSGTPFAEPHYGVTPVAAQGRAQMPGRPMVGSALGMARNMGGYTNEDPYPRGGGR